MPANTCNVADESFKLFKVSVLQAVCEWDICAAININEVVSMFVEKRQTHNSGDLIVLDCHEKDVDVRCGAKASGQGWAIFS